MLGMLWEGCKGGCWMCMARANHFPTGKRDYPVNMFPFSYPIAFYSRILSLGTLWEGGLGRAGGRGRAGGPTRLSGSVGPRAPAPKGNLPRGRWGWDAAEACPRRPGRRRLLPPGLPPPTLFCHTATIEVTSPRGELNDPFFVDDQNSPPRLFGGSQGGQVERHRIGRRSGVSQQETRRCTLAEHHRHPEHQGGKGGFRGAGHRGEALRGHCLHSRVRSAPRRTSDPLEGRGPEARIFLEGRAEPHADVLGGEGRGFGAGTISQRAGGGGGGRGGCVQPLDQCRPPACYSIAPAQPRLPPSGKRGLGHMPGGDGQVRLDDHQTHGRDAGLGDPTRPSRVRRGLPNFRPVL